MAPGYRSHPQYISIHALREEGDAGRAGPEPAGRISIHALREEGDMTSWGGILKDIAFLSTPSARRATDDRYTRAQPVRKFLSTPSARRATGGKFAPAGAGKGFLSTPSARRAT